jgi:hypothetical protein
MPKTRRARGGQGGERDDRTARYGRRYSYREDGAVDPNDVDGSMEADEEEVKVVDCPPPT